MRSSCRLKDTVRRNRPEKWRTNSWFATRQCSSTPVNIGHWVLNKEQIENTGATPPPPPNSPDLSSAEFYLLLRTQSELKARRFCDANHIIKNATKELKRLSQNGIQDCFQQLYRRWQKCIFAQGDYCEGNVSEMFVLFRISYKLSDSGNILKLPRV